MCGIAGIVRFNQPCEKDAHLLKKMCQMLAHRGPDAEGMSVRNGVSLGMSRLAIIDVANGRQPYESSDGSIRVVFNGEIYNHKQLRAQLEAEGYTFKSNSDGEVIIPLWEKYGENAFDHLNGMFAIALHDHKNRKFLLVRDRIGIKPLYYALNNDILIFSSEIKAILAADLVPRKLNPNALGQFLSWEYIPGEETLFQGIKKLEPASLLDVDLNRKVGKIKSWWKLPIKSFKEQDWEGLVEHTLQQSISRRMMSDVPLGAFLSGGVDSSLITAGMGKPSTFSIGFEEESYNELPWSHKVSEHLGCSHHTEILKPNIESLFDHLMNFMEDPIGDFSIFPTYLVSKLAREQVTVVLSGDGGDELFGGYDTYRAQSLSALWKRSPPLLKQTIEKFIAQLPPQRKKKGVINKARRFIEGVNQEELLGHARWRLFLNEYQRKQLLTPELSNQMTTSVGDHILKLYNEASHLNEADQGLYVDMKSYLCDNILLKLDRMSMACSLEARVPFLDHELVELAFQVPSNLKKGKALLKKLAAKKVPKSCVYRPKEGFSIPIKNWLTPGFVEERLPSKLIEQEGIFQGNMIERLKREHFMGKENHSHILWSLMVFQDWRQRWKV